MNSLHNALFGIYPYICLAVFFIGSLMRFDRDPYTWKSESSQTLNNGLLRWGSPLFHFGVLGIFFGHLAGLLTPLAIWHALGVSPQAKQMLAIIAGGIFGGMGAVGGLMLLTRRLSQPRVRKNSKPMDHVILIVLLIQLALGLATIPLSMGHLDGSEMLKFMAWAQGIWTFDMNAASYISGVHVIFQLHLFLGLTVFLLFPFSRLVHIWSGFATLYYLIRPPQIVRTRRAQ